VRTISVGFPLQTYFPCHWPEATVESADRSPEKNPPDGLTASPCGQAKEAAVIAQAATVHELSFIEFLRSTRMSSGAGWLDACRGHCRPERRKITPVLLGPPAGVVPYSALSAPCSRAAMGLLPACTRSVAKS